MINKRIAISLMSIAASFAVMGGATFAFFSDNETSSNNAFSAGSLEISLTDQNADSAFVNENIISNWAPGQEALVNFDVKNTGTLPLHLKGAASGTWGNPALDGQNMVRVIEVERWNGSGWETIVSNSSGILGDFYYTDTGTSAGNYFVVAPDERAQFQLTVLFDEDAGNDFETGVFTSSLSVDAKQVNAPAF